MTGAAALRCPSCGASVPAEAAQCAHCRVSLHPTRCPWCFDWTFKEARDCSRCGSHAEPAAAASCPSCREPLSARSLDKATLYGCAGCAGVWADAASFKTICADRETQSAYLGEGSLVTGPRAADPLSSPVVYRPCAVCAELMNRYNFAGCSGVILDTCRSHGVWFDPDELRGIVAFIRGGGLDVAREKERLSLELERRRFERAGGIPEENSGPVSITSATTIASTRDLLRFLLK